ncbi:GNAT family N-acetyltransferase [Streptomyces griseus]|uniref:GNAT family N-acetyltransferase n=1 Tax=Streptomyces griseus TaxID=1911 RepID=UPI000559F4F1|nr:GNAT family N-acetyltransferase [Streptomyces griseus]
MTGDPLVRPAEPADLPRVAELAAQHARYERAAPPAAGLDGRLAALLFATPAPRLSCLVAQLPDGEVVGYATCEPAVSTWEGRAYLHMDCLFLAPGHRGLGLGALLVEAVLAEARRLGLTEVQWQTPVWNERAARFYDRLGARAQEKLRYSLPVVP